MKYNLKADFSMILQAGGCFIPPELYSILASHLFELESALGIRILGSIN